MRGVAVSFRRVLCGLIGAALALAVMVAWSPQPAVAEEKISLSTDSFDKCNEAYQYLGVARQMLAEQEEREKAIEKGRQEGREPALEGYPDFDIEGEIQSGLVRGWTPESVEKILNQNPDRARELYEQRTSGYRFGAATSWVGRNADCGIEAAGRGAADALGISELWESPLGQLAEGVVEGSEQALETSMTMWTKYKVSSEQLNRAVGGVQNIVYAVVGLALISAVIVGGVRLAVSRRQGVADGVEDLGKTIGLYLIFGLIVPPMLAGAMVASDGLADWILDSFGGTADGVVLGGALGDGGGTWPISPHGYSSDRVFRFLYADGCPCSENAAHSGRGWPGDVVCSVVVLVYRQKRHEPPDFANHCCRGV